MAKARYIMIGGFLGAGKTTTLLRFAEWLEKSGLRAGLITNDQAADLVDTGLARARDIAVEEIAGGCFCCRFSSLMDAARNLTERTRPDILLAEPVGSCTDLVATVGLPLQQIYGEQFTVSPLSVLLDPLRAQRVLGLEDGRKFTDNVLYIYRKQLEEAAHIVINKADLLTAEQRAALEQALREAYPAAKVWTVSARSGEGLEPWFTALMNEELAPEQIMEMDYPRYGDGEARLGWLNAAVDLRGEDWDGNAFVTDLAHHLQVELGCRGAEIAHLKMLLSPAGEPLEVAAVNLVRSDSEPELSHTLTDPLDEAVLLVNCRAEGEPDALRAALEDALGIACTTAAISAEVARSDYFRPGMPNPEHRVAAV